MEERVKRTSNEAGVIGDIAAGDYIVARIDGWYNRIIAVGFMS